MRFHTHTLFSRWAMRVIPLCQSRRDCLRPNRSSKLLVKWMHKCFYLHLLSNGGHSLFSDTGYITFQNSINYSVGWSAFCKVLYCTTLTLLSLPPPLEKPGKVKLRTFVQSFIILCFIIPNVVFPNVDKIFFPVQKIRLSFFYTQCHE